MPRMINDSFDAERQREDNERSLAMEDARMVPASGSRVEMTPIDVAEDMKGENPRAPKNTLHTLRSHSVRQRLDSALALHGTDGTIMQDPSSVEDAMIAAIDKKRAEQKN